MSFFKKGTDVKAISEKQAAKIDAYCGLQLISMDDDSGRVEAEVTVSEKILQPFGLLHGGVSCLFGESIGSLAANLHLPEGQAAVGQSLVAQHVRSARLGDALNIVAEPLHSGRSSQVWDITIHHQSDGKMISRITLTMKNIET